MFVCKLGIASDHIPVSGHCDFVLLKQNPDVWHVTKKNWDSARIVETPIFILL
jgi:hypothetical protein